MDMDAVCGLVRAHWPFCWPPLSPAMLMHGHATAHGIVFSNVPGKEG